MLKIIVYMYLKNTKKEKLYHTVGWGVVTEEIFFGHIMHWF
jgi:hypothetical protein